MDYEKEYNTALERASKLRVQNPFDTVGQMVEHIFPELKESEDEKMKKAIIHVLYENYTDAAVIEGVEIAEIVAWLEKLGEQKPYGQRKECEDCQFNYAGECKGSCQMKRDEQNPADDVEPKFKVGDWVVLPFGIIAHIDSLNSTDYQVTTDGKICDFKISKQDNYRLWTIADAKDGDLIYISTEENGIQAIFHEYKNDTIFLHCYLCADFVQGGYMPIGSVEQTYPLQKTHYNRFFEKMHEAGYKWDSEKKELKYIETKTLNPDKVIEWLNDQACQGWIEDVEIDKFIAKFKEDFGL